MTKERFTFSGIPVKAVYNPKDVKDISYENNIGEPGQYPFTRGAYPQMYRHTPWVVMCAGGFDSAEDTRKRIEFYREIGVEHYLGKANVDLFVDLPTHYGLDSDNPGVYYEIGKQGVHLNSINDMQTLMKSFSLDNTHAGFITFGSAPMLFAMYIGVAENQGVPLEKLFGAMNNNPLAGPAGENCLIFPPRAHLRLMLDAVEFCIRHVPNFRPLTISTYDMRETGITALQELAFGFAQGIEILRAAEKREIKVDDMAANMNFHIQLGSHFFEEIAKIRAARRMWAKIVREQFGAENPKAWSMKTLAQTAGSSLQQKEPLNNIVRAAIQALVGVFGGVQSLYPCSYDEAYSVPTQEAAKVAVRTQQIIREETGIPDVADPLGGSYYLEWLTNKMEEEAWALIKKIEEKGGYLTALESGFIMDETNASAFKTEQAINSGERCIVGVNKHVTAEDAPFEQFFRFDPETPARALENIKRIKQQRNQEEVQKALTSLREALHNGENTTRPMIEAFKVYATLGEVVDTCKEFLGIYIPR